MNSSSLFEMLVLFVRRRMSMMLRRLMSTSRQRGYVDVSFEVNRVLVCGVFYAVMQVEEKML
jgi:hypothetical protein